MFIFGEMTYIGEFGEYSSNDPPCVGIVQPIDVHPWRPSYAVRHRAHLISSRPYLVHCRRN